MYYNPLKYSILFLAILLITGSPRYESNDDMAMIAILSGVVYGNIYFPDAIFLAKPLSILLSSLYNKLPAVPWYSLFLYISQLLGLVLCLRVILKITKSSLLGLLTLLSCFAFYSYIFYRLNFTSTSLLFWFAIVLNIAYEELSHIPVPLRKYFLYGAALGIAYLIRPSSVLIAVMFSTPIAAIFVARKKLSSLICIILPVISFVAANYIIDAYLHQIFNYQHYEQYNVLRSNFVDTGLGSITNHTTAAIAAAGWINSDYSLGQAWWFHDESIFSIENLNTFLQYNHGNLLSMHSIKQLFSRYTLIFLSMVAIIYLWPASGIYRSIYQYKLNRKFLVISVLFFLSGVIFLALVRFPPRIAIPTFLYLSILALICKPFLNGKRKKQPKLLVFLSILIICLLISAQVKLNSTSKIDAVKSQQQIQAFAAMQELHGTSLMFVPIKPNTYTQSASPFKEYKDLATFNTIPEGWMIRSPLYYQYLQQHGINSGKDLIPSMINNQQMILYYYGFPDDKLILDFADFINYHYAANFPENKLVLESIMEYPERTLQNVPQKRFIFYRIIAE